MTPADLKSAREALGLTQAALAQRLSVSENTLWRWETGRWPIEHPGMLHLSLQALLTIRQLREFEAQEFDRLLDRSRDPSTDPVRLVLASDAVLLAQRIAAFLEMADH